MLVRSLLRLPEDINVEAPNINYKATGHLIASQHIERGLFAVLVHWREGSHPLRAQFGDEYVVSFYQNGSAEWLSGSYFSNILLAAEAYDVKIAVKG